MGKYIINGILYDTKKSRFCGSSITQNLYLASNGKFFEVETFWGISLGRARGVSIESAKRRIGEDYGDWRLYEELFGKVPEA